MDYEPDGDIEMSEEQLRKRSISFGFSAMLDSIIGSERSHVGYTKLEPEESRIKRDRVRTKSF